MPVVEEVIGPSREAPARRVTLPVFLAEDGLVTGVQDRRLREKRMAGKTLAAAVAGKDERAGGLQVAKAGWEPQRKSYLTLRSRSEQADGVAR